MPMVQAYAHELLNQKESGNDTPEAHYASDTLFDATERLMTALERLEQGLSARAGQVAENAKQAERARFFERENSQLKSERETLNASIAQLQQDYSDLQSVAGTIYRKLSDSIKRLTNIIGD